MELLILLAGVVLFLIIFSLASIGIGAILGLIGGIFQVAFELIVMFLKVTIFVITLPFKIIGWILGVIF
jgi:hypothetical protein